MTVDKKENQEEINRFFPLNGDFRKNPKTNFFCAICQKDLDPKKKNYYVFLGDPCDHVVHPDYLEGNEIKAPIGSECIKKIPNIYRV